MSVLKPGAIGREVEREEIERLNADDQAARAADWFLDEAMREHLRKRGGEALQRGTCANCEEACAEQAIYCDADCRADHERRLAALALAGRPA